MDPNISIGFGDGLITSLFAMIIVFAGLVLIALLISALGLIGKKKEEPKTETKAEAKPAAKVVKEEENDEELVAVIAAAVSAMTGISTSNLQIKSIKRADQMDPWAQASQNDRLINRL